VITPVYVSTSLAVQYKLHIAPCCHGWLQSTNQHDNGGQQRINAFAGNTRGTECWSDVNTQQL